jgi:hypothetical protein
MQTRETVDEYLARGGKIQKMDEVKIISWSEARDLLERIAYQIEEKATDEAELDALDQKEGFSVTCKEEAE